MNTQGLYHVLSSGKVVYESHKTKPRRDKLVIETEKAYKASNQYQIDKLVKLERRYATRLGKAEAGLRKTRRQLQAMLTKFSHEKMGERYVP